MLGNSCHMVIWFVCELRIVSFGIAFSLLFASKRELNRERKQRKINFQLKTEFYYIELV